MHTTPHPFDLEDAVAQAASRVAALGGSRQLVGDHGVGPGGRALAPVMPHFAQTGLDGAPATDAQVEAIRTFIQGVQ